MKVVLSHKVKKVRHMGFLEHNTLVQIVDFFLLDWSITGTRVLLQSEPTKKSNLILKKKVNLGVKE
jgi:hypothetical protein